MAQAAWRELRRDIALEVVQVWGEAYTAQSRAQAWGKSLQVHQRLLDQIARRAERGLSAQSDLDLAVGRRQAVLADRMNALASLDAARERLQTLTGQMPAARFALPAAVMTRAPTAPEATDRALSTDPTLERMRSEEQELRAQLANTASALWPEVSLNVVQRHGDVTGTRNLVTVGLESRLGGGLSNLSAVQAASQRMSAKQEDILFRQRKLGEQIRADLRLLDSTRVRIEAYGKALVAAEAVADSWDRQYFAGKKSWQEVMNAAREIAQTEVQLIDATAAATVTEWRLAVLTGELESLMQASSAPH